MRAARCGRQTHSPCSQPLSRCAGFKLSVMSSQAQGPCAGIGRRKCYVRTHQAGAQALKFRMHHFVRTKPARWPLAPTIDAPVPSPGAGAMHSFSHLAVTKPRRRPYRYLLTVAGTRPLRRHKSPDHRSVRTKPARGLLEPIIYVRTYQAGAQALKFRMHHRRHYAPALAHGHACFVGIKPPTLAIDAKCSHRPYQAQAQACGYWHMSQASSPCGGTWTLTQTVVTKPRHGHGVLQTSRVPSPMKTSPRGH